MKYANKILLPLIVALIVTGCDPNKRVNKETTGMGVGAVTGALMGYGLGKGHGDKEWVVALGAVLGGIFGAQIGAKLNQVDKQMAGNTLSYALENNSNGVVSKWHNPDSGHRGQSTPTRTYKLAKEQYELDAGTPCREFKVVIEVEGKNEDAYGTACRQGDGSWKIVS